MTLNCPQSSSILELHRQGCSKSCWVDEFQWGVQQNMAGWWHCCVTRPVDSLLASLVPPPPCLAPEALSTNTAFVSFVKWSFRVCENSKHRIEMSFLLSCWCTFVQSCFNMDFDVPLLDAELNKRPQKCCCLCRNWPWEHLKWMHANHPNHCFSSPFIELKLVVLSAQAAATTFRGWCHAMETSHIAFVCWGNWKWCHMHTSFLACFSCSHMISNSSCFHSVVKPFHRCGKEFCTVCLCHCSCTFVSLFSGHWCIHIICSVKNISMWYGPLPWASVIFLMLVAAVLWLFLPPQHNRPLCSAILSRPSTCHSTQIVSSPWTFIDRSKTVVKVCFKCR